MRARWGIGFSIGLHAAAFCALACMGPVLSTAPQAPVVTLFLAAPGKPAPAAPGPARDQAPALVKAPIPQAPKPAPVSRPQETFFVAQAHAQETAPPLVQEEASAAPGQTGDKEPGEGQGAGPILAMAQGSPSPAAGPGEGTGIAGATQTSPSSGKELPRFTRHVEPEYPLRARRLGKQGTVLLLATIDEQGKLEDVKVLKSAGFGMDEAALAAVESSTFLPGRMHGRAIRSEVLLPYRFGF